MNDTQQPDAALAIARELLWVKTVHEETCDRYERHINEVYSERNKLISLVMRMCEELNFTYGMKRDPHPHQEGWDYIAFFDLPSGQCSFHIPNSELPFFSGMPTYPYEWDGHTTLTKYERILAPDLAHKLPVMRPWGMVMTTSSSPSFSTVAMSESLVERDEE